MYNEEEVLTIIADCDGSVTQAKKWLENFKK
jgi:TusA-related sulfurtransferase